MPKAQILRVGSQVAGGRLLVVSIADGLSLVDSRTLDKVAGSARIAPDQFPDDYEPTPATAGVYWPLAALTAYNSPDTDTVNWTQSNVVIENKIIYGRINRQANNVVFRNCLFRGPMSTPSSETAIVNCNDTTYTGWEFWDCTFAPQWPNQRLDAVKSNNFRAIRCHSFWTVDGFGVFSNSAAPANGDTRVEIAGCLVEDLNYNPGTGFSNPSASLLNTGGTYGGGTAVSRSSVQPGDVPWIDSVHGDGNHTDAIQVQGGYGRMTRVAGTERWTGTGIYIHHNAIHPNDAVFNDGLPRDPSGLGIPIPGTVGSRSGSRVGFGDNPKRGTNQAPGMTRPVVDGPKRLVQTGTGLLEARYAGNGSGILVQQNVNQFPYPNASFPNDYTVVATHNKIDWYHVGFASSPGSRPSIAYAWLFNLLGPHAYQYSSNDIASASIYPERVYNPEITAYANARDGSDGMLTNLWRDPTNVWGRDGLPLINSGNRGGLRYN